MVIIKKFQRERSISRGEKGIIVNLLAIGDIPSKHLTQCSVLSFFWPKSHGGHGGLVKFLTLDKNDTNEKSEILTQEGKVDSDKEAPGTRPAGGPK